MAGQRLLVVEDELLVALDIESILSEAGMAVVGPASSAGEALKLIADTPLDAALLDANLSGEPIDAVAQALSERGIPFAYVTGYGRESLPAAHPAPIVTKPFDAEQLLAAARRLLAADNGTDSAA
ncbi:MAG TPA: response regulator [Aestuariivirgaceae bacterium]|nr:response regulator [Aestuariivirgaceae bacterium]